MTGMYCTRCRSALAGGRFCHRCGAPVPQAGDLETPDPVTEPAPTPIPVPSPAPSPAPPVADAHPAWTAYAAAPRQGHRRTIGVVMVVLALIGGAAAAFFLLGSGWGGGSGEKTDPGADPAAASAPDCSSVPEFTPTSAVVGADGATIAFDVRATCESGQWVDSPGYRLDLVGKPAGSPKKMTLVGGRFDFASDVLWVRPGDEGSKLEAFYPFSQIWISAEELNSAIDQGAVKVVASDEDESDREARRSPRDPSVPGRVKAAAVTSTDPDDVQLREQNGRAALERIVAGDRETLEDEVLDMWVPQLSSKRIGTVEEGVTYDYAAIFAEHQLLRERYPKALLLWTEDWDAFASDDFWVTVVNVPSSDSDDALAWCVENRRDAAHCYAKLLREFGGDDGTVVLQEAAE